MKYLFVAIALILCINVSAQGISEGANVFVRVYDLQNKKIAKGKILAVTDSTLQLQGRGGVINVNDIGLIRTKRSAGHNVLIGTVSFAGVGAIAGAASSNPSDAWFSYTAGEGAVAGVVLFAPVGAAVGGISSLFKKSTSYLINGDSIQFKDFNNKVLK